jgi:glycosyltransferase involved in cell wall biosynthesis
VKLVIQNTSGVWGGNEKWLATLAGGLTERGHEVIVSCRTGAVSEELARRGIRTAPYRPRGAIDFFSGFAFSAWLAKERPDAVLLTSWRVTPWGALAARMARVPRLVMRLGIVRDFPRRTPKALALRSIDAVIVNSAEIRDRWTASAPAFARDRVHVVLNGVRSRLDERSQLRSSLRAELGIPAETVLVGGAGHLAPRKGFELLIDAVALLPDANIALAILGDGSHRAALVQHAERRGIAGRVHWLGHRADGAGAIAGFDLFVLSSGNEGMANVMLEAMAGGVPVVAFDISGVRQAIGRTAERPPAGWTVTAGDVSGLAAALQDAASSLRNRHAYVESMSAEAHWRAANWFSPDRMVEECETILFPALR